MENRITFKLREGEEFIPLIQLLKIVQVAGSGGEAQALVLDEKVRLNGKTELRKRAKIRAGDVVNVFDFEIIVNA